MNFLESNLKGYDSLLFPWRCLARLNTWAAVLALSTWPKSRKITWGVFFKSPSLMSKSWPWALELCSGNDSSASWIKRTFLQAAMADFFCCCCSGRFVERWICCVYGSEWRAGVFTGSLGNSSPHTQKSVLIHSSLLAVLWRDSDLYIKKPKHFEAVLILSSAKFIVWGGESCPGAQLSFAPGQKKAHCQRG